jgi:hypothetical protein
MIAAGAEHTAAVTEDGDLYGWGWGRYGNLGLGDRNDRPVPEKVSSMEVKYLSGLSVFYMKRHIPSTNVLMVASTPNIWYGMKLIVAA